MLYDTIDYQKRDSLSRGFWGDFTSRDVLEDYPTRGPMTSPSVNIMERENEYRIEMIAPGLCKDNYQIQIHDNVLDIIGEPEIPEDADNDRYTRREYYAREFQRSFVLPENVKHEEIGASCTDGILTVHLPLRRTDSSSQKRKISIH